MKLTLVLRGAAWVLLLGLVFVTLAPAGYRPVSSMPVPLERGAAVALVGFVFAIAYPRHILAVSLVVLGATVLIELLQLVAPSRHGRVIDVVEKLAGGVIGLALGHVFNRLRPRS